MQKKIYFHDKPLFLASGITKELQDYLHHEDTVFIDEFNIHAVKTMISEMESPKIQAGIFLHDDVDAVFKALKKKFIFIEAAGGLVHTEDDSFLLIFRRGKWDLPKGKLDEGEELEGCAAREIKEETGLETVHIKQPLCITYHTYHQDGKAVLKASHWFFMTAPKQIPLLPQQEEDIEKCEWVSIDHLASYMENMPASIRDVLREGLQLVKG
jgi:8-oxo-dGTP pyrophosphatase MutT (NUDIX family)